MVYVPYEWVGSLCLEHATPRNFFVTSSTRCIPQGFRNEWEAMGLISLSITVCPLLVHSRFGHGTIHLLPSTMALGRFCLEVVTVPISLFTPSACTPYVVPLTCCSLPVYSSLTEAGGGLHFRFVLKSQKRFLPRESLTHIASVLTTAFLDSKPSAVQDLIYMRLLGKSSGSWCSNLVSTNTQHHLHTNWQAVYTVTFSHSLRMCTSIYMLLRRF